MPKLNSIQDPIHFAEMKTLPFTNDAYCILKFSAEVLATFQTVDFAYYL